MLVKILRVFIVMVVEKNDVLCLFRCDPFYIIIDSSVVVIGTKQSFMLFYQIGLIISKHYCTKVPICIFCTGIIYFHSESYILSVFDLLSVNTFLLHWLIKIDGEVVEGYVII